jgi:hypothetical protein
MSHSFPLLIFLGFATVIATKTQLHATHVTPNFCNYLRKVAHDIQLHATLCMQHIYIYIYIYDVNIHIHTYIPIQM